MTPRETHFGQILPDYQIDILSAARELPVIKSTNCFECGAI